MYRASPELNSFLTMLTENGKTGSIATGKTRATATSWYYLDGDVEKRISWDALLMAYDLGQIKGTTLVWSTDLSGWQRLETVLGERSIRRPVMGSNARPTSSTARQNSPTASSRPLTSGAAQVEAPVYAGNHAEPAPRYSETLVEVSPAPRRASYPVRIIEIPRIEVRTVESKRISIPTQLIGAALLVAGTWWYASPKADPLEALQIEMSQEDYFRANALLKSPTTRNETLIAAIRGKGFTPAFHVFSRLPEQAEIQLTLKGVPGTLLRQPRYESRQKVKIVQGRATSADFTNHDGGPLPYGEYTLSVTSIASGELLSERTYFIAGQKPADYENQLKTTLEAHALKAKNEKKELIQILNLIRNQLELNSARFNHYYNRVRTGQTMITWPKFRAEWAATQDQIRMTLESGNPAEVRNTRILEQQHQGILNLDQDLRQLQAEQDQFLNSGGNDASSLGRLKSMSDELAEQIYKIRSKLND